MMNQVDDIPGGDGHFATTQLSMDDNSHGYFSKYVLY
jgi:hypothetical protein